MSNERMVTYQGKTQNLSEWEKETGILRTTIRKRLDQGKPIDECFAKPKERRAARKSRKSTEFKNDIPELPKLGGIW